MPTSIGQVVARLRRRRGLSQAQLQRESGGRINANWLGSLESGRVKNPPQDKLELLCQYLGTTVLDIYREAGVVEIPYPADVSPLERDLLEGFRALSPEQQHWLVRFIKRDLPDIFRVEVGARDITVYKQVDAPAPRARRSHG